MKDKLQLLLLISLILIINSCSVNKLDSSSNGITHYSNEGNLRYTSYTSVDFLEDKDWKSIIKKELPRRAKLSMINIYPNNNSKTILVDFTINNKAARHTYFESINKEKSVKRKTKIECKGICSSSGIEDSCNAMFDKVDNNVYCDCQDDKCFMDIKTF